MTPASRLAIAVAMFAAACGEPAGGGDPTPDAALFGVACTNTAFDPCLANDQCDSANCHLFRQDGIQVCTATCTPFEDTTCPVDAGGTHGKCNMMGICKPSQANQCDR